jgi:hypothetical protein
LPLDIGKALSQQFTRFVCQAKLVLLTITTHGSLFHLEKSAVNVSVDHVRGVAS